MMTEDIDKLMAVMATAFDPLYGEAWNRRQVEDALVFGHTYYSLISADGTPATDIAPAVGFTLSRHGFGEEELLLIGVTPEHRQHGLGRILLNWLKQAANKRGAERLLLEMRRGNPAETLYISAGFHPIGVRPNYYHFKTGEHADAITFACDIQP